MTKGIEGSFENPVDVNSFSELKKRKLKDFILIGGRKELVCERHKDDILPKLSSNAVLTLFMENNYMSQSVYEGFSRNPLMPRFIAKYDLSNANSNRYVIFYEDCKDGI